MYKFVQYNISSSAQQQYPAGQGQPQKTVHWPKQNVNKKRAEVRNIVLVSLLFILRVENKQVKPILCLWTDCGRLEIHAGFFPSIVHKWVQIRSQWVLLFLCSCNLQFFRIVVRMDAQIPCGPLMMQLPETRWEPATAGFLQFSGKKDQISGISSSIYGH